MSKAFSISERIESEGMNELLIQNINSLTNSIARILKSDSDESETLKDLVGIVCNALLDCKCIYSIDNVGALKNIVNNYYDLDYIFYEREHSTKTIISEIEGHYATISSILEPLKLDQSLTDLSAEIELMEMIKKVIEIISYIKLERKKKQLLADISIILNERGEDVPNYLFADTSILNQEIEAINKAQETLRNLTPTEA